MESTPPRIRDIEPASSPKSNGGTANCSQSAPPIVRSLDQSPYPTTFVQADASNFKHVVQMLTGSSDATTKQQPTKGGSVPPIKSVAQKKPGFKLYERRNTLRKGLMINTLGSGYSSNSSRSFSPRNPEILSPSFLDFPSLVISPATPLNQDCLSGSSAVPSPILPTEEEKAIAAKKFYLHPSPPATPGNAIVAPQLLPLFPVTSPRVSESSSS